MKNSKETGNQSQPPVSTPEPETDKNRGQQQSPREVGGPRGPEPTRYGDWEKGGRCIDF